ncbi:PAS domain-containing protein [Oceanimonas sp. NS1]|nr:PAS domain-containing protein [Oceanimonas sp. NS1]
MDEAKLLRDSWGKPQEVIGLYIDVTDAVIANEELNISKERYRILIEDSPAIICRYSYELDLTFANKQLLSYLKIENLKDNSINLKPFLSEDQISNFNKRLKSLTPSKPIVNAEICFQFPNQEPLWVVWAERGILTTPEYSKRFRPLAVTTQKCTMPV